MTHTPHPSPASAWAMAILVTAVWCLLLGFFQHQDESPEAAATYSRDWAATVVCGQNAAHQWVGDDLQCLTKHGRRTGPRHSPQQVAALALQQAGAGTVAVAGAGARP